MGEFFNVKVFYKTGGNADSSIGHIVNALTSAINVKDACLPKYLLVVADFDPLHDLPDVFHHNASTMISDIIYWMVRQINSIVRRKRLDLLDKKPGSLSGFTTHIIFVRMLRCLGSFRPGSTLQAICDKRAKLNDALNDAVAKIDQHILTINTCSAYEHFNH